MDSGNSGSIQSSSGGDEDYDSRAADDSSFNNPSSTTTTTNPLLFSHSSTMFDPLSNYFNPPILTQPQSDQTNQTLMNTNMPTWSKPQPNPFFTPMSYTQHSQTIGGGTTTTSAATATVTATTSGNNNQDQSSQSAVVSGARNPKKRSRASRRAPTTVLTTDTSNFRAMVQEFTGIPSPPFTSSSSPFPRTRLDLFTNSPTLSSSFRSPPSTFHHNLLRPFPHKIQPQLSTFTHNNHNINTISTAAAATSTTSPSAVLKQPPQRSCNDNYILNNMQIQNLAFDSFLPQPSSNDDQDFGILPSHTQVNTNLLRNISNKNNSGSDLNYAASGSSNLNFLGEKELVADDHHDHNVSASASTTRGEGLMESWICSSD